MRQELASTLSEHLLREAQRFVMYPQTMRRSEANLAAQEALDGLRRRLMEWRKTFAPRGRSQLEFLSTPVLLDEVYCRDLLKSIPEVVARTRRLSHMSLAGIAPGESLVYLREAANCYILGLPQAAVALARAAIESQLRHKAASLLGRSAVAEADLKGLLNDVRVSKLLSREGNKQAHTVRVAANRVLHEQPAAADDALEVVETARAVLLELSQR